MRPNIRKGTSSGLRTFPTHFSPYLLTNHPLNEYGKVLVVVRPMLGQRNDVTNVDFTLVKHRVNGIITDEALGGLPVE